MTHYNFKGDVTGISGSQLEFINKIIQEHASEDSKVTIEPVGKAGDNYAASVKRITIKGKDKHISMIAKMAPPDEGYRQTMHTGILFRNEHTMYFDVLPKFVQLQKEAGVPEEDQLKYAKCYGSFSEQPHEVILLEDLKILNFVMLNRFQNRSNDCIKSILKNFAVFHSLSYVLRAKEPDVFENFKENLYDIYSRLTTDEAFQYFYQELEKETLAVLELPEHKNAVKNKFSHSLQLLGQLSKMNENNKYAVIVQGDGWTNNIMFKFEVDKLKDSIMIDYQLARNGSPVYDLMYMIFNCTDHETRLLNFYSWIDYYYSELKKCLSNFDLDVDTIYPYEQLHADLKQYGIIMLGMSVFLANMLVRKTEDATRIMEVMKSEDKMEKADEIAISQLDEESRTGFKNKVVGIVSSFIEFGLL